MAKKKPATTKEPSFEQSLQELESVVSKLEGGKLPLADSLEQYELGVKHLKACYKILADAERRIELLSGVDADGRPCTEPFDDSSGGSLIEKRAARGNRRTRNTPQEEVDEGSTLF